MDANAILRELLRTRLGGHSGSPLNPPPRHPVGGTRNPPRPAPTL